jgi:superoxide reductase
MSTHKSELYHCEICGAVIKVKNGGDGTLKCCDQAMEIKQP